MSITRGFKFRIKLTLLKKLATHAVQSNHFTFLSLCSERENGFIVALGFFQYSVKSQPQCSRAAHTRFQTSPSNSNRFNYETLEHDAIRHMRFNVHCSKFLYNRLRNGKNLAGSTDESLTSINDTDGVNHNTKCGDKSVSNGRREERGETI